LLASTEEEVEAVKASNSWPCCCFCCCCSDLLAGDGGDGCKVTDSTHDCQKKQDRNIKLSNIPIVSSTGSRFKVEAENKDLGNKESLFIV
jgi:hypothetical protein